MTNKPIRTEGIKSGLLESLGSKKPNFRRMSLSIRGWNRQGFASDPRKTEKEVYQDIEFEDISRFYKTFIQNKPLTITVVGNKEKIDMEKLAKFGEIIEVTKDDIFN